MAETTNWFAGMFLDNFYWYGQNMNVKIIKNTLKVVSIPKKKLNVLNTENLTKLKHFKVYCWQLNLQYRLGFGLGDSFILFKNPEVVFRLKGYRMQYLPLPE